MSGPRSDESRPALEVTRVGSGASARIGALVVVGVLAVVVWVGFTNRPAPPPDSAAAPSFLTALPSSRQWPVSTARGHPPIAPPSITPSYLFAVSATIGDTTYIANLEELRGGQLSASLHIPIPIEASSGLLTIKEFRGAGPGADGTSVGDWILRLDALHSASRGPQLMIDAAMPARPNRGDIPERMRGGLTLRVYGTNDLLFGVLDVVVTLNSVLRTPPL